MNSDPPSSILHPRRILVRGTNWLGDAVMTTPALLRLREKFPAAHVALSTPEKLRELWAGHPAINETIPFAPGESVFAVAKKLRAGKFDLVLVLPNSPRSAIETWLAGIPQRIGYARPWRNFFLTGCCEDAETIGQRNQKAYSWHRLPACEPFVSHGPEACATFRQPSNPRIPAPGCRAGGKPGTPRAAIVRCAR